MKFAVTIAAAVLLARTGPVRHSEPVRNSLTFAAPGSVVRVGFLEAQELPPQDAPKDVLDFFRTAVEALADKDADGFLDHFDPKMPGYGQLSSDVRSLVDRSEVSSSVEFVSDQGDARKRSLQLDWLLQIDQDPPRRKIVKCEIEKRGTKWRIVSFDPIGFFGG